MHTKTTQKRRGINKNGISPLIATVLVLGFTVALAAIVMLWGQGFIKKTQESSEATAERQMMFGTSVSSEVRTAVFKGDQLDLVVENTGNKPIDKFNVRIYGPKGGADIIPVNTGVGIGEVKTIPLTYYPNKIGGIAEKVEALPVLILNGQAYTDAGNYAEGNVDMGSSSDLLKYKNGNFESWDRQGTPYLWNRFVTPGTVGTLTRAFGGDVYEGSSAVNVACMANCGGSVYAQQKIDKPNGFENKAIYFLSAKCKTPRGHNCVLILTSRNGNTVTGTVTGTIPGTDGWVDVSARLDLTSDTTSTDITIDLDGSEPGGTTGMPTFFDNVILYKIK